VTKITDETIYQELLKLDTRMDELVKEMEETVAVFRETNRQLAEGQARTEALKKRLFGDRFNHEIAAE
jgi:hypothetical protein